MSAQDKNWKWQDYKGRSLEIGENDELGSVVACLYSRSPLRMKICPLKAYFSLYHFRKCFISKSEKS